MFWRVILFCWLATQVAMANPTRSGTLTWSGSLPAPAVAITVNSVAAQTNGDFTFASSGLTLSNGANTFTVIAANALGLHTTNTFTQNLPVSVNLYTDAVGNATALLDANENVVARYRYDPFGRLLGQWGSLANANRMQFSSMPHHGNSGLSLYPFRAYDPVLQRWLSRDPIGEAGGIDLYAFAGNSPLNAVDSDGRVLHILAGAAAGALIGGGFSIASDLFHGRDVDWVQAGISATEGAIAGAVASATFGTSLVGSGLALAARGAAAGLAGDLAAQGAGLAAQTRQCFSFKEAGLSTLLGASGPLAGKLLGKFLARFAKVEIPVAAKGGGLYSSIGGESMDAALFKRIQDAFQRTPGRIMESSPASELHLGPNPLIQGETLSQDVIALRMNPSTSSVYEELIHTAQLRRGMTDLTQMQIEAAQKLIRFSGRYKIPAQETQMTIERLKALQGGR